MTLNPYLYFNGNCEAALRYYAEHLGGEIVAMMRYADAPPGQNCPDLPADWNDRIMHGRIVIDGCVLMGSDSPPAHQEQTKGFSVTLNVGTAEAAERAFEALARDGQVFMPLEETFWAVRFGMLTDRFGTPWMVNCEKAAAS